MKKLLYWILAAILLLNGCFWVALYADRYQTAVEWVEMDAFSKATSYLEFPFLTEMHDQGLVSYTYAGEAIEMGNYDKAISLLEPLAEENYRNSVDMLAYCMEKVNE